MKKICNLLLVMIMIFNVIAPCTVSAEEITQKIYKYDDYTIMYNIINSWTNNQNINITISNTGKESIIAWALKYDASGEINGLWNGSIYNCNETEYIIKSADYNYVIEPDSSVTFGYILTGDELVMPENIEICSKRVVKSNGYEVEFTETNDFGTSFQGEIKISNLTDEPIEAWTLTFDSNFDIEELSGAKLISQDSNTYEVADQQWAKSIQPDSTAVFGLSASKGKSIQLEIKNIVLSEIVFDDQLIPNIPDEPDISSDYDYYDYGIYSKPVTSDKEITYTDSGFAYVRNQILVMADDSISFEEMSDIANNMNAEIVGYIDITNEYQIEFKFDTSTDYLYNIIDELKYYSFIKYVSFNYASDMQLDILPNDLETNMNGGISDSNWNLYAINASRAWDYYNQMDDIPYVNIGIIDKYFFDINHDDLSFKKIWNESDSRSKYEYEEKHGTHIAGIIAAGFNNNTGITGICPKTNLYGFAIKPTIWTDTMRIKSGLSTLIKENVKVINISIGIDEDKVEILKTGSPKLESEIKEKSKAYSTTLSELIKDGYDFLIVKTAGNGGINAEYGHYINCIDDNEVKKRIIIVGAIEYGGNPEHRFWRNSNWGERVDVVAPGVNILSTVPNNSYESEGWNGTSVAAPHVAGIAGMMYAVNSDIKAHRIKDIITETSKLNTVPDGHGYKYGIVDAKLAVSTAYYYRNDSTRKIVFGTLKDSDDDKEKIYSNVNMIASFLYDGYYFSQNITSDENGEYEVVIPKESDVSTLRIKIDGYDTETVLKTEFYESAAVVETTISPLKYTITGKVTERNTTTGEIKPIADHLITFWQDDSIIGMKKTDTDGTYEIEIIDPGNVITVDFGENRQNIVYIITNKYEYTSNCEFLTSNNNNDDDDDNNNNGNGDNKDDGNDNDNNNDNEDSNVIIIDIYEDTGIDPTDPAYSGDSVSGGNMRNIRIPTNDGGYVTIFYDPSYYNEYLYATRHTVEYSYGALSYERYDANGKLIISGVIWPWLIDEIYYGTTLVDKVYITSIKITRYDSYIRVDYTCHKEQIYDGGLGNIQGDSYDHTTYTTIRI